MNLSRALRASARIFGRAWWVVAALFCGAVQAQSGGGYDLTWNTVDGGGATFSSGGVYSLGGTAGQPDAGNHAGGVYSQSGGFWYAPAALFSVAKDFSDNNVASVVVTLVCSSGVVTPSSALASEASPAQFTVTGYIGAPTCSATEVVPVNYTANESACTNVALASGNCTISNTLNVADLAITLSDTPDPVAAGSDLTYVATLTNNGPAPALDVNITLPLPAGTSFVSVVPSAGGLCNAASPVVCDWNGATAPLATRTATIVATVAPSTTGSLSATASASSTTSDSVPANNSAIASTAVESSADLSITLIDSPDPVIAGNNLVYTASLNNAGPSDAQDVSISLPLPAGTSLVSASAAGGGACTGSGTVVCTWTGATAPNLLRLATITVNVSAAQLTALSATATASAASGGDPDNTNNSATAITTLASEADLSVVLTDTPDPVTAGTQLSYLATLNNGGPSDAQDVSLTLSIPPGTTRFSAVASAGGSCAAGAPVICGWPGATAPGAPRSATVVVDVDPAQTTALTASVDVSASTTDPVLPNNTATTTSSVLVAADLAISLSATPEPVFIGNDLTYLATLSNNGPSTAQAVTITLPLPAGTSFVSATASLGGSCSAFSPVVCTWPGASLPTTQRSANIVARVEANAASSISATATADSNSDDPTASNDNATAVSTVSNAADLAITLAASPDPVTAGEQLSYTAGITNLGPSAAQDVTLTLPLPVGTALVSATADAGGSCSGTSTVVCTWLGATAAMLTRSAIIVVDVNAAQTAAINAGATVSASTLDPDNGNNNAAATTAVLVSADLALSLSDTPDPVTAGNTLSYSATINNLGPSDASGVTLSMPTPANTSVLSANVNGGSCTIAPVVCTLGGSIASAGSRVATIIVSVAPGTADGTQINATATVNAATADPILPNNTANTSTIVNTRADLQISLSSSAPQALVNQPVSFTATSLNLGPSAAQNVSISLTLNADLRLITYTPSAGATCSAPQIGSGGTIVCTWAGSTLVNATRTLQAVASSNSPGSTEVAASTTSATLDLVANNNARSVSVVIGLQVEGISTLNGAGLLLLSLLISLIAIGQLTRVAHSGRE